MESINKINKLLEAGEPNNISVDNNAGYSGYTPQAVMDALNEVLGMEMWGFDEISNKIEEVKSQNGMSSIALANVKIWVGTKENYRVAYGQSRVTRGDLGDAMKGAQTDAIKKALSYFSIGNRAYLGLLDANKPKKVAPRMPVERKMTQTDTLPDFTSKGLVKDTVEPVEAKNQSDKLRKRYFALADEMGIENSKEYIKEKLGVASFTDISNTKLEYFIKALEKKHESKNI